MSNIRYKLIPLEMLHVRVERILFGTGQGVNEIHAIVHLDPDLPENEDPIAILMEAKIVLEQFLGAKTLYGRLMLDKPRSWTPSDQSISAIVQPPLDGTPAALWLWMTQGKPNVAYRHTFTPGQSAPTTLPLLQQYREWLDSQHLCMAQHCLRTWFFVHDIDRNYHELVKTRREFFEHERMTPDTHYIASTGINGSPLREGDIVQMETYTVQGLAPQQIRYLKGSSHLNPTAEYGVTFERGTRVEYGDRCHLIISGTASIDNHGAILYPDDPEKQARRMVENVQVLLNEGGASLRDLMHAIVYLRRPADYLVIRDVLAQLLPDLPIVLLHAPVCRPGWLVEMECMAAIPNNNTDFATF
ncbi:MAG: hypothetical protein K6E86_01650 [Bacteroidales bacterium]|nr:hypothetical protein [Bacteroidales bacterium]